MPFTSRTNRIVRQRSGYTNRYFNSDNGFISNARAMHYNGNIFQTQQVLDGYDSDDSDYTVSTLELVHVESEDEYLYELAAELERIIENNE